MKKAKLIGKIYDRYGKFVDLEYEYRGKHTLLEIIFPAMQWMNSYGCNTRKRRKQ